MKYTYYLKRQKQSKKKGTPPAIPPPKTPLSDVTSLLGLAKNLDPDSIRDILDIVRGEDQGGGGGLADLVNNPGIQAILSGLAQGGQQKDNTGSEQVKYE